MMRERDGRVKGVYHSERDQDDAFHRRLEDMLGWRHGAFGRIVRYFRTRRNDFGMLPTGLVHYSGARSIVYIYMLLAMCLDASDAASVA